MDACQMCALSTPYRPCAGANPRLDDNLGRSALLEACYHGHDHIIDTLKTAGASLALGQHGPANSASSTAGRLSTSGSSSSNISGVRSSSSSSDKRPKNASADLAAAGSFGSLSEGEGVDQTHMGASWALQLASLLCNCVYECNLPVSADRYLM